MTGNHGKVHPKEHPAVAPATIMLARALKGQGKHSEAALIERDAPDLARKILKQEQAELQAVKDRAQSTICVSNLKQIGLAFQLWAMDHADQFPFNLSTNAGGTRELSIRDSSGFDNNPTVHLLALSNSLGTPVVLTCPADSKRPAHDWSDVRPANVGYQIRCGADANPTNSAAILAVCPIHGHVVLCDGTIQKGARSHKEP